MKVNIKYILIFFLATLFIGAPISDTHAQTVFERVQKRWLKKNKIKKVGKRALRMGQEIDLPAYSIKNEHDVIGLEPSWMIEKNFFEDHYLNLISTLVVGEYDINPSNGAPRSLKSFNAHLKTKKRDKEAKKEVNILERGDFYNPKMNFLLQLTYSGDFGTKGESKFWEKNLLTNDEVFGNLKDSLNKYFVQLNEDGFDYTRTGVFVDMDLTKNYQTMENFIQFLTELRLELHDNQLIYVVVPANLQKNYSYSLDLIKKIEEIADRIVIDGTGFEKYAKDVPTVVFDKNNDYSIEGTLKLYLKEDIDGERKKKIAVMLPYYGLKYSKQGKKALNTYMTFDNFSKVIGKTETLKYSKDTMYGRYRFEDDFYYMDDPKTLLNKYNYLKDSLGINHIALNSLSYYKEKDRTPRMWEIIALTYGTERSKLGWTIASYLMAFIPIGFIYSCYKYWEVRNALAKYNNFFTRFVIFFVVFTFLYLTAANVIPRNTVGLIIGLIIMGLFALYIIIKKVLMRSKKYVNIVK